jgi:uncharacterized Ntn-hydrolase superfamily protein
VVVATRFFAAGALCPRVEGGVAALATQALVNPMLGLRGMERLRHGAAPQEVLDALLAEDAGRESRQFHILDAQGRIAQHTGTDCVGWCGAVSAPNLSVAGNMLAGAAVLEATRDAFLAAPELPMADRLLHAIEAGQAAGGDARGRQVAALMVASGDPYARPLSSPSTAMRSIASSMRGCTSRRPSPSPPEAPSMSPPSAPSRATSIARAPCCARRASPGRCAWR